MHCLQRIEIAMDHQGRCRTICLIQLRTQQMCSKAIQDHARPSHAASTLVSNLQYLQLQAKVDKHSYMVIEMQLHLRYWLDSARISQLRAAQTQHLQ